MRGVTAMAVLSMAFAAPATAQTCSTVDFVRAVEIPIHQGGRYTSGLQRMSDGSLTKHSFLPFDPYRKLETAPNFQEAFFRCTSYVPPARVSPATPPSVGTETLGMPSRNPLVTLLAENLGAVMGVYTRRRGNNLVVGLTGPDVVGRGSTDYPVGTSPTSVTAADFNGDGIRDVAVVNNGTFTDSGPAGGVSVLLGNGDGTLKQAVTTTTGRGALSATPWDFNGDRRVDLVVANSTANNVSVLISNADGTFQTPVNYSVGSPTSVTVADLNGDSRGDLIIANQAGSGSLAVLFGNADGTFRTGTPVTVPIVPSYIATGDFNKDGRLDLAAIDYAAGVVAILNGRGNAAFDPPVTYLTGQTPETAYAMDFDWDGNLDIVIASGHPDGLTPNVNSSSVQVLFGRGDGTFRAAPTYMVRGQPHDLAAADFNKDGRLDLAAATAFGDAIPVMLSRGGGAFQNPVGVPYRTGGTGVAFGIASGDYNRDGNADLAVADASNAVRLLAGKGDGTFNTFTTVNVGVEPRHVILADFNGDGRPDLATANAGPSSRPADGDLSIVLGNGDGTFRTPASVKAGAGPSRLAAADFNGDGRLDLAVANYVFIGSTDSGGISVLIGNGDGTFRTANNYPALKGSRFVTAGDLNKDGAPDLIGTGFIGEGRFYIAVLMGNGDGTFQQARTFETDFGPEQVALADYNGDSNLDMIVTYCCGDTDLAYHLGNGDGTFQPEVHFRAGDSPMSIVTADLNGDSKLDLVIGNVPNVPFAPISVFINSSLHLGSPLVSVPSAGFERVPVAPDSIVSSFGSRLATEARGAETIPWPMDLAGTTVMVRDAAGAERQASLSYVSNLLVNFLMPPETVPGIAQVTVRSGDGTSTSGPVEVRRVAPGLFTVNPDRLAAAGIVRVRGGEQFIEEVFRFDPAANALVAVPIDLGPADDQVFLVLYGTGIRFSSGAGGARATVANIEAAVSYAGAQTVYPGVDLVTLLLPRTLRGRGAVDVVVSIDGITANTVRVTIR